MRLPDTSSSSTAPASPPDPVPDERLDIIQRVARVGFWELQVDNLRLAVSNELRTLFGIPADAPAPDFATIIACVHPDDRQRAEAEIARAIDQAMAQDLEYRVLHPDGAVRHIHARGELVRKAGVLTYYGTVHDITEQREAELATEQLARRLCDTLESISDAFYTVDRAWRLTYLNGEAERLFQRPREQLLGKVLWDGFGVPEKLPGYRELQRAMRERTMVAFDDYYPSHHLHCEVRAYPLDAGLAVYVRDITLQQRTEDALRQSEERFRIVARATTDLVWDLDLKTGVLWFSGKLHDLFGYTPGDAEDARVLWREHIHPDDRRRVLERFDHAMQVGRDDSWSDDYRFVRKDGSVAHVHDRAHILRDGSGKAVRAVGAMIDVSQRHAADARIREQASLLDKAKDAIVVTGLDHRIRYWNKGAERLYGWRAEDVLGRAMEDVVYADAGALADAVRLVLDDGAWSGEMVGRRRDGSTLSVDAQWTLMRGEDGEPQSIFAINTDVTKRKEAERRLHYLAFHDVLTHLPNRHLLVECLREAVAASRRSRCFNALLLIDLDNFKTLNDTLGHALGDQLLQQVALRLYASLHHDITVARIGGDEYAVLLADLASHKHDAALRARREGERIIGLLNQPYQLDGYHLQLGASIGATVFADDPDQPGDLLKHADMAMYQAKAAGRGIVRFYDPALAAVAAARLALENDLRTGLREGLRKGPDGHAFFLHYQPQVERNGRIAGVEALIRWQHPTRGMVSPAEFIPLAEEIGLALPLGQWVLECACRQLAAWAGEPETAELEIAVNVSARQLHHPAFVEQVLACIGPSGADPRRLKLEITEGTLLDDVEDAVAKIKALKAHGLTFAIDDFGTGYSSLAYLKRLPLDMLKIDRSFVLDLTTNPNDAIIARTIIALGASLGLKVLAEGVETEAQRDFLFENGCQAYQGYLCARPLAADALVPLLRGMERERPGGAAHA